MNTIPVVLNVEMDEELTLGNDVSGIGIKLLETNKLKESFENLTSQLSDILSKVELVGNYKLNEIQLAVEITAEGGFALIGNAKVGTKGSIFLTFKK